MLYSEAILKRTEFLSSSSTLRAKIIKIISYFKVQKNLSECKGDTK